MNATYILEDFKKIICYRLSPGGTDLPFIPFFDMAITFYMLLWNIGTIGTSPAVDDSIELFPRLLCGLAAPHIIAAMTDITDAFVSELKTA